MSDAPKFHDPFIHRDSTTGEPTDWRGIPLSVEQRSAIIKTAQEEWLRKMDQHHGVIKSLDELTGLTVVGLSRYKPGVVRYFAVGHNCSRTGFAKDSVLSSVQLPL